MSQQQKNMPKTDIAITGLWAALPRGFHPYISVMRLDRPIGWWLLLLPSWWAILASASAVDGSIYMMALFLIGAVTMRAAGCVINDLMDRDIDKHIERTSIRPIASGEISIIKALCLLAALGAIGLAILLQLPVKAWVIGILSFPFIALYPLFKRFTYWPQAMLGLTFSWGILLGHVAISNSWPDSGIFILYSGTVFWVIGYDTIYVIQDMKDDEISGVKSSALAMKSKIAQGVRNFYGLAIIVLGIGFYSHLGLSYWLIGLCLMAAHLFWQIGKIDEDNPEMALRLFKSNRDAGLLLSAALLLDLIV